MKKVFNLRIWLITLVLMLFASVVYANSEAGKFIVIGKTIFDHGNVNLVKLNNGKILLADFDILYENPKKRLPDNERYIKKFELYNTKTRKFESMSQPIYWHSNSQPIALDDGRVLVVGASCPMMWNKKYVTQFQIDTCEQSQYAETYDPAKNQWKLAGKMQIPRGGFGITKLQDGRVLITNGNENFKMTYLPDGMYDNYLAFKIPRIEATAEIFDPKTETFSLTGSSTINIVREAINAKKEKCLVANGNYDKHAVTLDNGEVLVLWTTDGLAEIYDPKTGKFRRTTNMIKARKNSFPPTIVKKLQDGRVIIISGHSRETWNAAEIFDPQKEYFSDLGKMAADHGDYGISYSTVLKNGKLLIIGGIKENRKYPYNTISIKSMEIFDPKTNRFKYIGEMSQKISVGNSILLDDGNVLFIGSCRKSKFSSYGILYKPNYKIDNE